MAEPNNISGQGNLKIPRVVVTGRAADALEPSGGPLSLFASRSYRLLCAGAMMLWFGQWSERLVVGFLILNETDSIFLTAASFASRSAIGMVIAPFAGVLVDRLDRRSILLIASFVQAGVVAGLGLLAVGGLGVIWPVMVLVAINGASYSFSHPAMLALTTDLVSPSTRMTAVSVLSTGMRTVGVLGALIGGLVTDAFSASPALFGSAVALVLGGLTIARIRYRNQGREQQPRHVIKGAFEGIRFLVNAQPVAAVLSLGVVVEIFGFAYNSILPAVARDVLGVGATGLGTLSLMAGIGSLGGVLFLSWLGDFRRKGLLLLGVTLGYGVAIVTFSWSTWFYASLGVIMLVGAMAAIFDALQWTLVQALVPERMRGRALAGWVFAISFGWVGHLLLGTASELIGLRWALLGTGLMLVVTAFVAFFLAQGLRRA